MKTRNVRAALLMVLFCGCSGGGSPPGGAPPAQGPITPSPSPSLAPYPPAPYGDQVGQTLADITLGGFRLSRTQSDSSQLTWDNNIKLSDFFYDSSSSCLVITIGATWCGACQEEQPRLIEDVDLDTSFAVLGVLQEGPKPSVDATLADVDQWTAKFRQNFTVVQGNAKTNAILNHWGSKTGTIGLPFSLIVNPRTMEVLDGIQGYDPAIHDYAVQLCSH